MAGAIISVDVTDKEVRQLLKKLTDKIGNPTEALHNIGARMLSSVQENFEEEGRPEKWVPRKDKKPHPILRSDSNNLFGSIHPTVQGDEVKVGTLVEYAAIHQFGGETGKGYKTVIPARPYLMLQDEDNAAIIELLEDYITEVTK